MFWFLDIARDMQLFVLIQKRPFIYYCVKIKKKV